MIVVIVVVVVASDVAQEIDLLPYKLMFVFSATLESRHAASMMSFCHDMPRHEAPCN